jgi:hypothetical protein
MDPRTGGTPTTLSEKMIVESRLRREESKELIEDIYSITYRSPLATCRTHESGDSPTSPPVIENRYVLRGYTSHPAFEIPPTGLHSLSYSHVPRGRLSTSSSLADSWSRIAARQTFSVAGIVANAGLNTLIDVVKLMFSYWR